jgi:hypothetical protein
MPSVIYKLLAGDSNDSAIAVPYTEALLNQQH